jgi:hypothetical protein
MRDWARLGTLALGVVLIGCGPQPDVAPSTPIAGATMTVGGAGTGTPAAGGSATAAPAGSVTTVSLAPTLAASATPGGAATATARPLATATTGVSRSPAAGTTVTGTLPITGTTVPVPITGTTVPVPIPPTAAPVIVAGDARQVVRDFLASVQGNPDSLGAAVFFSRDLQSRLSTGTNLLTLLHLPSVYQTFNVTGPDPDFTVGSGVARAILTYPDGPLVRDFRLQVEANSWVITSFSSPDEGELTPGNGPTPAPGSTALPAAPTPIGSETPPSLAPPTVEGAPTAPGPLVP